jgi:hypothetical protein
MKRLKHPVRSIREPFGKAGLTVAILALVLAMVGGAYAAGGLTKSQEKQVKKIAKKYAGKPGAAGVNGTNGATGPQGPAGSNGTGTPGSPGTNGNTVLSGPGAPSGGVAGDFYIKTGAEPEIFGPKTASWPGSGTKLKGPVGPEGVCSTSSCHLPTNVTETGEWYMVPQKVEKGFAEGEAPVKTTISFNIPLSAPIANHQANPAGYPAGASTEEIEHCPGSVTEPKAASGYLCVYTESISPVFAGFVQAPGIENSNGEGGSDTFGAHLLGLPASAGPFPSTFTGIGSWAVTG